jgi:hypothetical protein
MCKSPYEHQYANSVSASDALAAACDVEQESRQRAFGVHEALHPLQRVQDGDMLRVHSLPRTKGVNPRSVPDFDRNDRSSGGRGPSRSAE